MGLLQLGFGEIRRKFRRVMLSRKIKAAAGVRASELRTLGKRAAESGATGPASAELMAALAETQARQQQLGSQLGSLDEKTRNLEAQREADAARFKGMDHSVCARKAPLDAELATHQSTAVRTQRESEDIRRRQEKLKQERQALEESLRKPPTTESTAAADRARAEARLTALSAEQPQLEAQQVRLAEAGALAASEVEKLKTAIAPLQADLDRITAQRNEAADRVKRELADLRKETEQVRAEAGDVSRRRDQHHEALGAALVAAGAASPALAAEMGAVAAASEAQAALQRQYDSSLADSSRMPKRTMLKFSALMLAAFAALGAGGYAANQAMQSAAPPASLAEDCRMTYGKRKPLEANPGGPYSIVRGGEVSLDGSKSKGSCLKYKWTFAAAAPDPSEKRHPATGGSEDDTIFALVEQLACPAGQAGNPGALKTGAVAKTTFLCSLKVTLTVTDGQSSDSKSVDVKVKARGPTGWQTQVEEKQAQTFLPGSKLARAHLLPGKNVCAHDEKPMPAHAFHAGASWKGEGYTVAAVKDPGGPFDAWSYIGSTNLRIKRSAQLNQDLAKDSELHKVNRAQGYKDFDVVQQAVLAHELLHGTLIFETMAKIKKQGNDPAKIIEGLSIRTADEPQLVDRADVAIRQVQGHLLPAQQTEEYINIHKEIKARLAKNKAYDRAGTILVRDGSGDYVEFTFPNIARAGEDGG